MNITTVKKLPAGWRTITSHYHPVKEAEALKRCAENCVEAGQATLETVLIFRKSSHRAYVALRGPEPPRIGDGGHPRFAVKEKLHEALRRLKLVKPWNRIATAHATEADIRAWIAKQPGLANVRIPASLNWTRALLGVPSAHGGHRKPKPKADKAA